MTSPSSRPPAGVPRSGGNTMYAVVATVLVLGIVAIVAMRSCASKPPQAAAPIPTASVAQAPEPPPNPKLEDIPPPPPPEQPVEAGAPAPRTAVATNPGCDSKCVGAASPELEQALAIRGQQARRCYNQALAQDSSLKGHVSLAVRVGPAGNVCSVTVASNDMGTPGVANCAANIFRQSAFPLPRGGCIDANVPLSFVSPGH